MVSLRKGRVERICRSHYRPGPRAPSTVSRQVKQGDTGSRGIVHLCPTMNYPIPLSNPEILFDTMLVELGRTAGLISE